MLLLWCRLFLVDLGNTQSSCNLELKIKSSFSNADPLLEVVLILELAFSSCIILIENVLTLSQVWQPKLCDHSFPVLLSTFEHQSNEQESCLCLQTSFSFADLLNWIPPCRLLAFWQPSFSLHGQAEVIQDALRYSAFLLHL